MGAPGGAGALVERGGHTPTGTASPLVLMQKLSLVILKHLKREKSQSVLNSYQLTLLIAMPDFIDMGYALIL